MSSKLCPAARTLLRQPMHSTHIPSRYTNGATSTRSQPRSYNSSTSISTCHGSSTSIRHSRSQGLSPVHNSKWQTSQEAKQTKLVTKLPWSCGQLFKMNNDRHCLINIETFLLLSFSVYFIVIVMERGGGGDVMYGMYRWPLCMIVQIKPCGFVDPTWRSCCAYVTLHTCYTLSGKWRTLHSVHGGLVTEKRGTPFLIQPLPHHSHTTYKSHTHHWDELIQCMHMFMRAFNQDQSIYSSVGDQCWYMGWKLSNCKFLLIVK